MNSSMSKLSNPLLIKTYHLAIELNLDKRFIKMISEELERRKLSHSFYLVHYDKTPM